MADSQKLKRVSQNGKKVSLAVLQRSGSVMQTAGSYLKKFYNLMNIEAKKQLVHLKDPSGKKIGTIGYYITVPNNNRFTFKNISDARMFKKALKRSVNGIESVIIRIDTTEEGYIASERVVK